MRAMQMELHRIGTALPSWASKTRKEYKLAGLDYDIPVVRLGTVVFFFLDLAL